MNFNNGVQTTSLVPWKSVLENQDYDIPHPLPLALTPSLSFQDPPCPKVKELHVLSKRQHLIDKQKPKVSGAQIEAALLILSRFLLPLENGRQPGAFLGDQTGCGKTRIISLVIDEFYENPEIQQKRSMWVSCAIELANDATKELEAITSNLAVMPFKSEHCRKAHHKIDEMEEGILFTTYNALRSKSQCINRIVSWLGSYFSGVIVFDECHACKKRNDTSRCIKWIQKIFPWARILYVSATIGTESSHMWYMDRLGLWGKGYPFPNVLKFEESITNWGINAMELISNHLQKQGTFVARQLNVKDVQFLQHEVEITSMEQFIYDHATILWQALLMHVKSMKPENKSDLLKLRRNYWSCHLKFFQALIQTFKAKGVADIRRQYPPNKYSLVISIQNTGEDQLKHSPDEVKSSMEFSLCRELLRSALKKFGIVPRKKDGEIDYSSAENIVASVYPKISDYFGKNPLDQVIEHLGGESEVAEITGRRGYHTKNDMCTPGSPRYYVKAKTVKMEEEINKFQNGDKRAAVISQKGATGISLHADRNRPKHLQRVHVIFQTPWVAENAIQQIGRTNRSNQASTPIYIVMSTRIPGEHRFIQTFLERLSRMGAICHGERMAGASISDGFSDPFQEAPQIAALAAKYTLEDIDGGKYSDDDLFDAAQNVDLLPSCRSMKTYTGGLEQFLNRTLGVKIETQGKLVKELQRKYLLLLKGLNDQGMLDPGIRELIDTWNCKVISTESFGTGIKRVQIHEVLADRGVSWQNLQVAIKSLKENHGKDPTYFVSEHEIACGFQNLVSPAKEGRPSLVVSYNVYTPWSCEYKHVGANIYANSKWKLLTQERDYELIREKWQNMFEKGASLKSCIHNLSDSSKYCTSDTCRVESSGCRRFKLFLLTGCLLYVWATIQNVFQPKQLGQNPKSCAKKIPLQVLRLKTKEKAKVVKHIGIYVPRKVLTLVKNSLRELYLPVTDPDSSDDDSDDFDAEDKTTLEVMQRLDQSMKCYLRDEKQRLNKQAKIKLGKRKHESSTDFEGSDSSSFSESSSSSKSSQYSSAQSEPSGNSSSDTTSSSESSDETFEEET